MGTIIKAEDSRRIFVSTLNELAKTDPNIIVIICDVGFNYLDDPSNKFKVINLGVTEASATIIAAALALSGFSVWIYTMIPFVLFRPYEMVRNAIVKHSANVKLIGVKGSEKYKFLGFSHNLSYEEEDIDACKNIGLRYHVPKSLDGIKGLIIKLHNEKEPSYIRL
ncbi:MAG: hypothetical protein WD889_01695 [Candidatus Colwellbacteria bacterium]